MLRNLRCIASSLHLHHVTININVKTHRLHDMAGSSCQCSLLATATMPTSYTHTRLTALSGTTWVGRYRKGKTNLDFTEARDSEWQWRQLGHMQVCTSLQTDNHASTPPLSFLEAGCPSCHNILTKHLDKNRHRSEILLFRAFSALTLLVGCQEEHLACKKQVTRCWCHCLSGARCR